jgi:hypothetical protein
MEIDELPENDERSLRKPEIKRDEMGRFEQHGTGLIKKAQSRPLTINNPEISLKQTTKKPRGKPFQPGGAAGPGRPVGSLNKTTKALKDMILGALDRVGGEKYLAKLAIENSSAFASLVGKVLPTTLQASESNGGASLVTFQRVIVMPDGQKWVEGVTPKQLPAPEPAPVELTSTQHTHNTLSEDETYQ